MPWRKFGANSILLTIATVTLALLQWSILMFIARVDGPSLLGEYSLAQAYAAPAFFLGSLSLRTQYLIWEPSGSLFSDFMFLRFVFPAVIFVCFMIFICIYYTSQTFIIIAAAIFAMKYVEGFFDLASAKMQREGDIAGVATTNSTRCLLSIIAFGAIYLSTHHLLLALCFLPVFWVALLVKQRRRLHIDVGVPKVITLANLRHRVNLAVSLFPFSVSMIINSLSLNAPRFILHGVLGPRDLGFFSAISHFLVIGALVTGSVAQMALPSLVDAINKRSARKFWQRLVWPAVMVQCASAVGVMIAIAMGPELLNVLYGSQFARENHTLVVATIVAGPLYCSAIFVNGCYAAQMRRELLIVQCVSLLVVVAATSILVPRLGVDGAYFGLAIFAAAQICLSIILLARFLNSRWFADTLFWIYPTGMVAAVAMVVVAGIWLSDIANKPLLPGEAIRETASAQESTPLAEPEAHRDSPTVTAQDQSTFTQLNGPTANPEMESASGAAPSALSLPKASARAQIALTAEFRCKPVTAGRVSSIEVHLKNGNWSVVRFLRKGPPVERARQYRMRDTSDGVNFSWEGQHKRNHFLKIRGQIIMRSSRKQVVYKEEVFKTNKGKISETSSRCTRLY